MFATLDNLEKELHQEIKKVEKKWEDYTKGVKTTNPYSEYDRMSYSELSNKFGLEGYVPVEEGLYFPKATFNYGLKKMEELVRDLPAPEKKGNFSIDNFKSILDTLGISFQVSEKYSNWAGPGNPLKGGFDGSGLLKINRIFRHLWIFINHRY